MVNGNGSDVYIDWTVETGMLKEQRTYGDKHDSHRLRRTQLGVMGDGKFGDVYVVRVAETHMQQERTYRDGLYSHRLKCAQLERLDGNNTPDVYVDGYIDGYVYV